MLNEKEKEVVRAAARHDMRWTRVAGALGMHRNTVLYRCGRIKSKTGLDPCKFYDLIKLLEMVKKDVKERVK